MSKFNLLKCQGGARWFEVVGPFADWQHPGELVCNFSGCGCGSQVVLCRVVDQVPADWYRRPKAERLKANLVKLRERAERAADARRRAFEDLESARGRYDQAVAGAVHLDRAKKLSKALARVERDFRKLRNWEAKLRQSHPGGSFKTKAKWESLGRRVVGPATSKFEVNHGSVLLWSEASTVPQDGGK